MGGSTAVYDFFFNHMLIILLLADNLTFYVSCMNKDFDFIKRVSDPLLFFIPLRNTRNTISLHLTLFY